MRSLSPTPDVCLTHPHRLSTHLSVRPLDVLLPRDLLSRSGVSGCSLGQVSVKRSRREAFTLSHREPLGGYIGRRVLRRFLGTGCRIFHPLRCVRTRSPLPLPSTVVSSLRVTSGVRDGRGSGVVGTSPTTGPPRRGVSTSHG